MGIVKCAMILIWTNKDHFIIQTSYKLYFVCDTLSYLLRTLICQSIENLCDKGYNFTFVCLAVTS
jgi:hypothetical protein